MFLRFYNNGRRWNLRSSTVSPELQCWLQMGENYAETTTILPDVKLFQSGTLNNYGGAYPFVGGVGDSPPFVGGETQNLSGNLEYAIPARTGSDSNQSIIVNRFSSPGGFDVSSQGYMDPAHEEFSVYNALPFRNQHVINYGLSGSASAAPSGSFVGVVDQLGLARGLNQRLQLHTGRYGADAAFGEVSLTQSLSDASLTVTKPSFHKTQRNPTPRLRYAKNQAGRFNGLSSYVDIGTAATWDALIGEEVPMKQILSLIQFQLGFTLQLLTRAGSLPSPQVPAIFGSSAP